MTRQNTTVAAVLVAAMSVGAAMSVQYSIAGEAPERTKSAPDRSAVEAAATAEHPQRRADRAQGRVAGPGAGAAHDRMHQAKLAHEGHWSCLVAGLLPAAREDGGC